MDLIPQDAREVVNDTYDNGAKMRTSYFVDGREIGWRYWDISGIVLMEYQMRDGKRHGRYCHYHDNGMICEEGSYEDDKEHGEIRQFDETGKQIGSYVMDHGTGLDLWFHSAGILAEEREYCDGKRHGFERFWNLDNRSVGVECHYWNDLNHGIFREWNWRGRMRRGYPQYYVMGNHVTKRQYERACRTNPTLPPYDSDDNSPERPLPAEVSSKAIS